MKQAIVLLSGGVDSAAALWWAKARGWSPATLSFLFPGRRRKELGATRRLRRLAGAGPNFEIPLPFVDPPRVSQSCRIPLRNLMFYAIAGSIAEKIGAERIIGGHIRHDREIFADARPDYLARIEALIRAGQTGARKIRMIFPFIGLEKKDIIVLGSRLNVPFQATWSCSHDLRAHCGRCYSCRERAAGFHGAGLADPLRHPHANSRQSRPRHRQR